MEDTISPSSPKNKNITLDDIKLFYKDRFIDFTRLPTNRYDNITNISLSENIKYIGKIDSNDIWLETTNNIYLCGIPFSPTRSWYKIKDISDIDIFQDYFNKTNTKDPQNIIFFSINLDSMTLNEFINYIYLNNFTEKQISETIKDLNRSIKNSLITYDDQIRILNNFIKINTNSFCIKTKYSKSIIKCEYHSENNNNYIIVQISFNELKLKNRYDNLPNYCPSDIGIIFNSLNTLSSIIEDDPKTATQFVQKLASVYRYVLAQRDKETVSLKEELSFIDSYVYLNKIRFGENLKVEILVDESFRQKQIATLTLQLLLENAIKHNVISKDKPLSIEIGVSNSRIYVKNNLQTKMVHAESNGIGLSNIISRYKYLSKEEVIVSSSNNYFEVSVPLID
jgi:hypothetical protein